MGIYVNGFLDAGFDNTQELKARHILDAQVSRNLAIKYNDIPVNVGAYNKDQKDIFINVFNSFDWYSYRSVADQLKDILNLLKGNFDREDFYAIYNNALDVAFCNSNQEDTLEERRKVAWDINDEFNACLDEFIKVDNENKPVSKFRTK